MGGVVKGEAGVEKDEKDEDEVDGEKDEEGEEERNWLFVLSVELTNCIGWMIFMFAGVGDTAIGST